MFAPAANVSTIKVAKPCAAFERFFLFSDRMDQQLGAKLVLNTNLTVFWACGQGRDVGLLFCTCLLSVVDIPTIADLDYLQAER